VFRRLFVGAAALSLAGAAAAQQFPAKPVTFDLSLARRRRDRHRDWAAFFVTCYNKS
jgi:hypothetical protein